MSASVSHAETPVVPVANFSSNVTEGYAPLEVQLNDSSENATNATNATGRNRNFGAGSYTSTWSEVTPGADWSDRSGHSAVSLFDFIIIMGGYDGSTYLNDVWRSNDGGLIWSEANSSAGWSGRSGHSAISLFDGSIVIMGGYDGSTYFNDVWRSDDGGFTWTEVTSNAGWSGRSGHSVVSLPDGSIMVIGGYDGISYLNDVWRSTDGGFTWTEVTSNAGWSGRSGQSAVTLSDGSIVIMGGYDGSTYFNDVWLSIDGGVTWGPVSFSADWFGRSGHSVVSLPDGSIIVMGGYNGISFFNDVWRSTNGGLTWSDITPIAYWSGRSGHSAVSLPDSSIIVMGGYDDINNLNDVWRLQLNELPVANFSSNATSGYVPLSVQFNDSSESATEWYWDFGDGVNSTEQNPIHTYSTVGNYTINLIASNVNGTNSTFATITVLEQPVLPVANFSSNVSSGHAPLSIQFTDNSENATEWNWDFGDGVNSTEQNPIHTYSTVGDYTVNLTAINGNGTDSKLSNITVSEEPLLPVANFSSNVTDGYAPLSVEFTDLSENADEWSWNFGDGSNSTDQNTTHTYSVAGNFTVNLTVSNLNGTNSTESIITVTEAPVLPVANFTSNVTEGYVPLTVEFTDSSENADGLLWDFGDGSNTTDQNPVHVFSDSGNFTVNLTVSNANGTDSIESVITVTDEPVPPVVNFTSNVTEGYAPLSVEFTDLSENADEWNWDFENDGITDSTEQNPMHTFSIVGNYTVNLTAINGNGTDSKTADITVLSEDLILPAANFTMNETSGYSPLTVQFTDSSENADEWIWDFGDGSNSTEQNPLHVFSDPGNYTVNLTVSNLNGTDSETADITVLSEEPVLPVANFSSNVSSGTAPLSVEFTDSSENADEWSWDFGDGSNSTDQNPLYVFSTAGNFTVNLTVSNLNGTDSKLATITVSEEPVLPVANFSSNVTSGNVPLTVQFNDSSENATEWNWDFGDGNNSTEQNPIHIYSETGNFTVNLTVINLNGTDSKTADITVLSEDLILPAANFTMNETSGYVPLTVQFNDSSENADEWNWDFGDGNNSTEQNPIHTYSAAGNYTVNLTASNVNGTDSKTANINVSDHIYAYSIEKTITDVSGNGSSANITKAGDIVSYQIYVENEGNINLTNVSVIDSFINLTGPAESLTSDDVLEVSENWTYTGNYTITQEDLNNNGGGDGFINNTATVDCDELGSESDSVAVPLEQNPDCTIKKFVVDIAGNGPQGNISSAGDVVGFRVNVTNSGNIDLTNISIHDSLINLTGPYGDTGLFGLYKSSPDQYTSSGDGILSIGETWYYLGNYTVTQEDLNSNGGGDGFLNSTVTFESSETDPTNESSIQYLDENGNESSDGGNSSSGIYIERNPDCTFTKSVLEVVNGKDGAVNDAGDVIRYGILVENEGNVELTGIMVSDLLISLAGPVESLNTDGVLELGENWAYTGNYTVTREDMDNEGDGDEDIDNTATLSCNELSDKTSSAEVALIVPESSSGSSHSSGGSGGGGGSPEPATNVEVKELSQTFVTNGKAVKFGFTKNATCVAYVSFDAKKTAGKTTTIAEQLKKKSTLTSNLTEGEVYRYFNVWVGNSGFATSSNIDNPGICFKVEKSWLKDKKIDQGSITLNRYNNKKWEQSPATLLKEDSKYLYFTADVSGYSFFAITGKSNASSGGSVTEIKPEEPEYVEENTGNNILKPETTDQENTAGNGSKLGIVSFIACLLIVCLAVAFLYIKKQEEQKK